ncbi:MAG: hypothetical protein IPG44_08195 [Anaerolineales bacterium]|nr:hypothetical protein [Anaerolineales bacterium]MCC6985021.1 hypothetical protein [Anaerolineales bacterium]
MKNSLRTNPPPLRRKQDRASGIALGLVAVLLAVSCAPTTPTESAPQTAAPVVEVPALTEVPAVQTEAPAVQPLATSRGDALEATDPATVNFASGQLQLVEFFRFT